jgi:hypothetical protein
VTEPRDGAPDNLEREPIDDEGAAEMEEGAPEEIDDEAIVDDLVAEDEADVDAEVDDYDAALREVAGEEPAAVPSPVARPAERGPRRRPTAPAQRAPTPSEIAVHVREDWSRAFVIITAAVFILILLNALLFGHGGFFTPIATPTPIPTESPSASPSAEHSASGSPAASPSTSASPSAAPSASPSASPSAAASASPS